MHLNTYQAMRLHWASAVRDRYNQHYDVLWSRMIRQMQQAPDGNWVWLSNHASYFFKTDGLIWAMDPVFRTDEAYALVCQRLAQDLQNLRLVVYTHGHGDHFDPRFVRSLTGRDVTWIVPPFLEARIRELTQDRVVVLEAGQRTCIHGLSLQAFTGLHRDGGNIHTGVPEQGYLAECGGLRLLFPGDVREYDASKQPRFESVDCLFAHVWLGRAQAAKFPHKEYVDLFCNFIQSMNAEEVFLSHVYNRSARSQDAMDNLFTYTHAGLLMDELNARLDDTRLVLLQPGWGQGLAQFAKRGENR